jgi:uncharacterized membrane protein YgdD (TMEM256/DUF423 family)
MPALARAFGAAGALLGALAVVASAWLAHAAALDGTAARRIVVALAMLAAHALALLVVATLAQSRRGLLLALAGAGFLAGSVAFSGSLFAAALLGWRPAFAPAGGIALVVAWLMLAAWFAGAQRK